MILFEECTSKLDLINNRNIVDILDEVVISANIIPCLDGTKTLYATIICEDEKGIYKKLQKKQIIKTKNQGIWEYFVINNPDKGLDTINITATHWTVETTASMFLSDVRPTELGSLAYLDWCKTHSEEYLMARQYARDLEVGGNITDLKTNYFYHKNFYDAIGEAIENYSGELKREGFKVSILNYVGSKTPNYRVEYGVNLIDNIQSEDWDISTGCVATGYDGIKSPIIYSGLLNDNPNLTGRTIEVKANYRVRDEEEEDENYIYFDTEELCIEALTTYAIEQFTKVGIDKPKIEFTTTFLDLSTTEEGKDIPKGFINIGDAVNVKIEKYNNLDVIVRVYEYDYNILTEEIDSITLTNNDVKSMTPPTLNTVKKEVEKLPSFNEIKEEAIKIATGIINQGQREGNFVWDKSSWSIMDEIKKERAKNVWKMTMGGLGFSKNGYDGPFEIALTMDGKIVLNEATVDRINARLIEGGVLQGFNGNLIINLETGYVKFNKGLIEGLNSKWNLDTGVMEFFDDGNRALRLRNSNIDFYDWKGRNEKIGQISSFNNDSGTKPNVTVIHEPTAYTAVRYFDVNNPTINPAYVIFDKYNETGNERKSPVIFTEETSFNKINTYELNFGKNHHTRIYPLEGGGISIAGDLWVEGNIKGSKSYDSRIQALENLELERSGLI